MDQPASVLFVAALSVASVDAQIPASPTTTLEGRVLDMRGEPVPAAEVWVTSVEDVDAHIAAGRCDGDGYFKVARVPVRPSWSLRATAPGRSIGAASARRADEPVTIVLHDGATLRGTLRNQAGAPVASVQVNAMPNMRTLWGSNALATTDADGRFALTAVPLGRVNVSAAIPGEGLWTVTQFVAGDDEVSLARDPRPRTSIRIAIDGLPDPAPPVSMSLLLQGGQFVRMPPAWDHPRTDAKGRCELTDLPDLDYLLRPTWSGLVFTPGEMNVKAGTGPHVLHFAAKRQGDAALACRAVLRDVEGKVLPGVRLALRRSNELLLVEATTGDDGTATFACQHAAGTEVIVHSLDPRWTVDPRQEKAATYIDWRLANKQPWTVDPAVPLELRALPACSVTGHVTLPDGRAAAFVRIDAEAEDSGMSRWMNFASTTTDRDGGFRLAGLHPLPQAIRLHVEGHGGSITSEPLAIAEAGKAVSLDLKLSPPATVEGVVRDPQGKPAPGIRVWLRSWDIARRQLKSGSVVEVVTDRQGRYRFAGVPPGGALLQMLIAAVDDPIQQPIDPFEVEAGKSYTFDLSMPAR
jgi:5-hydroxyisourate hydrolase-like protein (transthyretin family)